MGDIKPITGIDELWNWKNSDKDVGPFSYHLKNYKRKDGPELLLCHDMMGGYLQEESNEGSTHTGQDYPYMFLNWWNIDIFNYFSHNFVTIPPLNYTRIAHEHGVLSLGTFITEWKPGAATCRRFLESKETIDNTVDALVEISKFYGFDGWLINIENVIQADSIDDLLYFLKSLTSKSHQVNQFSRVIWYDSVLHSGSLCWQNALNHHNNKFYESCDAIYLNYNWNEQCLLDSTDYGKLSKIFIGIDVFGRGCIGGFDCYKSFMTAQLLRMSVALFAPGWIREKFPNTNQIKMGIKFWKKLCPYIRTRPLTESNFSTTFKCGLSSISSEKTRYCLSDVDLQPQCLSENCFPECDKGLVLSTMSTFKLFTFDNIEVKHVSINVNSDSPVEVLLNDEVQMIFSSGKFIHSSETGETFEIKSVSISTKNSTTILKNFEISTK